MVHPLLYEINTRCWLNALSRRLARSITLATVPGQELDYWLELGFTHIWLMGVWTTGRQARSLALGDTQLQSVYREILPGWRPVDVGGSPYAIADYSVPESLGGDAGLEAFRRRLNGSGIKLILDFVPNHLALDHPWVRMQPDLFVQASSSGDGVAFLRKTVQGARWLAHGKDPYFPAWKDTVQVDYRRFAARAKMLDVLRSIAVRCDGVRCDMAMLVLADAFAKTWMRYPISAPDNRVALRAVSAGDVFSEKEFSGARAQVPPSEEFWAEAIPTIKGTDPGFLFLAEAYWGLEPRLQALGFDYTYDKGLYDLLIARNAAGVQRHLLDLAPASVARGAYFLENHDEPRVASLLALVEHRAAALLILGLPGMRLLQAGQLAGARLRVPVQLSRCPFEPDDSSIAAYYRGLLTLLPSTAVGRGVGRLLVPRAAWDDNPTGRNFVLVEWQSQPPGFDLVVVNLASHRSQCYAPLTASELQLHAWTMRDLLGTEERTWRGGDLLESGLYLDLPAHGGQLLHFEPARSPD